MSELLNNIRHIEIKARGLSKNLLAGQYHSAFKGRGMAFAEVRDYQFGDDVRDIDWNVTARFHRPFVKVFEEERELTVMLAVDVSASQSFGTVGSSQREQAAQIAATLAFSAIDNGDKVGLMFFTDRVERYLPPKKGRKHILRIIAELLQYEPVSRRTSIATALEALSHTQRRRCTAFVLSDFLDTTPYSHALMMASRRHDLVAIAVGDKRQRELPDVGLLRVADAETGHEMLIDTSSRRVREAYARQAARRDTQLQLVMAQNKVRFAQVDTGDDYVPALTRLFKSK